ncbi:hypothetical protein LINPERPRIM_LOCUS20232 [Linum perenne]
MNVGAIRVGRCIVIKCCIMSMMTPLMLLYCGMRLTCVHVLTLIVML